MNQPLLILDILQRFGFRNTGMTERGDQPDSIYGPDIASMDFKNVWVLFNTKTSRVFEVNVAEKPGWCVFWIDPEFELAQRGLGPTGHNCFQVYSRSAILEIASAKEKGEDFDQGLKYEIDVNLDHDTLVVFEAMAERAGVPKNAFIAQMIRQAIVDRSNQVDDKAPTS